MEATPRRVQNTDACRMLDVQYWILGHLSDDLTLKTLAARAGLGVRHFTRLFQRETGSTAGDFVAMARVNAARRLLEESDMLLSQVARCCGFANSDVLRRAFLRHFGIRPGLYRTRCRYHGPGTAPDSRSLPALAASSPP